MRTLTGEQAAALLAFYDAFNDRLTGAWAHVEKGMRDDHGIAEPEDELDDAIAALR